MKPMVRVQCAIHVSAYSPRRSRASHRAATGDVNMSGNFLELRGQRIKEDTAGNICLTDLWHLADAPESKTTTNWRRLPTTGELVEALADNLRKSLVMAEAVQAPVIYSKPGKGGGTFAHPILALAYAE